MLPDTAFDSRMRLNASFWENTRPSWNTSGISAHIPAVEGYAAELAQNAAAKATLNAGIPFGYEAKTVKRLSILVDQMADQADALEKAVEALDGCEDIITESYRIRDEVLPKMDALRSPADEAETLTSKKYWPFPSYGDLLFSVK